MDKKILDFYLQFSEYTNPGLYQELLLKNLPDNIKEIGLLVRKQLIHRATLKNGNTGSNKDLRYGDMTKVPWYRQAEDDIFPTVSAMITELFRRDPRGFILARATENKLVLTCRFTAILMASILKSKGIPARVRSGFAPYFLVEGLPKGKSDDHWVNQYWDKEKSRWITVDIDGSLEDYLKFDPYDIPEKTFDFSADAWIDVRKGKVAGNHFEDASGFQGLVTIGWELFHDFHCLMNNEVIYLQGPSYGWNRMNKLTEEELEEIDNLAQLMQNPDDNFDKLEKVWETNKKFRILKGGLL
ncbi:MAG: transglutaminase-like domain-containing protein [Microgenomates group bacterium]|jgi:hypothetical protein